MLLYIHCHEIFITFPNKNASPYSVAVFCLQKKRKLLSVCTQTSHHCKVSIWQMLSHCSIWYSVFSLYIIYISNFSAWKILFSWEVTETMYFIFNSWKTKLLLKICSILLMLNLVLNVYFLIHWQVLYLYKSNVLTFFFHVAYAQNI